LPRSKSKARSPLNPTVGTRLKRTPNPKTPPSTSSAQATMLSSEHPSFKSTRRLKVPQMATHSKKVRTLKTRRTRRTTTSLLSRKRKTKR